MISIQELGLQPVAKMIARRPVQSFVSPAASPISVPLQPPPPPPPLTQKSRPIGAYKEPTRQDIEPTTSELESERAQFRTQLSALLSQLDRISATGSQLSGAERELLAALERRLRAGGAQVGPALGHEPAEGGAAAGAAADRAHLDRNGQAAVMRYSTPNLLLSSHFEHILRQQDRRAKQEQPAPEADPPEATEAWFLSRSPTAGRASGAGAAGPTGSRESVRRSLERTARSAQRALEPVDMAASVCGPATLCKRPVNATDERQQQHQQHQQQGRHSTGSVQADVQVRPEGGETRSRASCQSAPNEIFQQSAATLEATGMGDRADSARDERPSHRVGAKAGQHELSTEQVETGAGELLAESEREQAAQQSVSSTPAGGQNPTHDKSMAQARYLYSTLTSNTGALLASQVLVQSATASSAANNLTAATSLGSGRHTSSCGSQATSEQKPPAGGANKSSLAEGASTKSPVRSLALQRKRAQFVTVAERQHLEAARVSGAANVAGETRHTTAPPTGGDPQTPRVVTKSGARGDPDESSDSDSGGGGGGGGGGGSGSGGDHDNQRGRLPAHSPKRIDSRDQQDECDEQDDDLMEPPAIIESACEQRRRSSQTSRSISMDTNNQSLQSQLQQQPQHPQQLQPAMDPEMHALWAQGADLDTGNGNFIQATRRRRSVHAIHQVQLHQQQQQLAGAGRRKQKAESAGGQQAPTVGLTPSDSRNFKDKLRKLRSSGSIEESRQAASSRARFVSDPVSGEQRAAAGEIPEQSERDESDSSWSARQSEPLTSPKLEELADDEEEAAAAATAAAAPSRPKSSDEEGEGQDQDDVLSPARRDAPAAGQPAQELVKRARLDTDQAECLEEIEFEDEAGEERRLYALADAHYDLEELESGSSMLAQLYLWNYPIFELSERYGRTILSKLSYRIFFDSGFFDSFKIPKQAFFSFFHALEEGYHDKPYHNRLHAADVLHAVYYLTSQPIEHFCQVPLDLIELYDKLLATTRPEAHFEQGHGEFMSKLHNHVVAIVVAAAAAAADSELPFGLMGANLTALEVMALYTAAAMHDFQHPGRTNSFLVATSSPLALLYNDRSVLENHHSAAAWALFYSGPNLNWLCNLEKDEFKRFRFMIIELILATDLMRHYELVSAFNKKLNNVGRHNIDWFCESDRLLVMEIIIKLADVNGPMKGHQLHCQWTERIAMEFYEQGDEERALNLPVSLYMDRSDPRLPELQKSFINHLVGPLSHSYAAAGFFPKSNEPKMIDDEAPDQPADTTSDQTRSTGADSLETAGTGQESVYSQSKYWLIEDSPDGRSKLNRQFLDCVQTMNLRNNFLYWDAKSKLKQQHSKQSTASASSSIDQSID